MGRTTTLLVSLIVGVSACGPSESSCLDAFERVVCFPSEYSKQIQYDGSVQFSTTGDSIDNVNVWFWNELEQTGPTIEEIAELGPWELQEICGGEPAISMRLYLGGGASLPMVLVASDRQIVMVSSLHEIKLIGALKTLLRQIDADAVLIGCTDSIKMLYKARLASRHGADA